MSEITYMVGLPGSGKSTIAHKVYADRVIVSTDAIRGELYGDESVQGDGARVFAIAHGRMLQALRNGQDVVFDATNLTKRSRARVPYYRALGYKVTFHVVDTPLEVCLERNAQRDRHVPEDVIRRMAERMCLP